MLIELSPSLSHSVTRAQNRPPNFVSSRIVSCPIPNKGAIFAGELFQWQTSGRLLKQAPRMDPRKQKIEAGTKDFDDGSDEMIEYLLQKAEANLSSTSSALDAQPLPRFKYVLPATSLIIGQFLEHRRTSLLKRAL